jgi:hypothetical protein
MMAIRGEIRWPAHYLRSHLNFLRKKTMEAFNATETCQKAR